MLKNPDFEQDIYSRTARSIFKKGHDSIWSMKWLTFFDRSYYENMNYYELMGSILNVSCKHTYNCMYISSINTNIIVLNTHITKKSTQV